MTDVTKRPTSLVEAVVYFSDPERSFSFVKAVRWGHRPVTCSRRGHAETSFLASWRIRK
jgi:hypothetical protein